MKTMIVSIGWKEMDMENCHPLFCPYVKDRIPEVKNIARIADMGMANISYKPDNKPDNLIHIEANALWVDSTIFDIFSLNFIQGDYATALTHPHTVVIAESVAKKLFGDNNPIGKSIGFVDNEFMVTGIIGDIEKSHLKMEALFSLASIPTVYPGRDLNSTGRNSWLWSATYFLTAKEIDEGAVEKKINGVLKELNDGKLFDTVFKNFHLRPLKKIYFDGAMRNLDYGLHGSFKMISMLFMIGVFMLVLACINYINLTTARSTIRTKEIAIKRIVGSSVALVRLHLILESIIVSGISLVVALTVTQGFIGKFNEVATINIRMAQLNRPEIWIGMIISIILLGIIAGIYPAIYLTAVRPVKLIKGGAVINNTDTISYRSILMTFQFTLSIILVVCAITNLRQLNYIRNADLGFNKEQIILVETPDPPDEYSLRETFKKELLQVSNISGVTNTAGNPGGQIATDIINFEGETYTMELFLVDHDFFEVMDVEIVEGRRFSPKTAADFPTDVIADKLYVLVNETFVRELGMTSPVGHVFYWYDRYDRGQRKAYEVIGVAKDFHFRSLHHKISPLILIQTPPMHMLNIRVQPANITATLKSIESVWKKLYGDRLFTFKFLDEVFDRAYKRDVQLASIINWFTGLALIIACLGLFALASFIISRRTKEIGIRKTMGASIQSIYVMLSWDFLKWIILAVIIACPLSWYLMQLWLNKFAYHINLETDIFIIAALPTISVSLLTITWQSLKAASSNPINALRYE